LRAAVEAVVGAPGPVGAWQETAAFQLWSQTSREVLASVEGLEVPATLLEPVAQYQDPAGPVVVFIDEGGRRAALETWGPATRLSRMLDRDPRLVYPTVLVPDLPGWGDSTPALAPYALAGWGSMDRLTAYLSCALGDGLLAIRARCAAALVRHLDGARGVEPGRVVLVGRGLGGAVALMAAALCDRPLRGVATWGGLASFGVLAEAEEYAWPAAAFLPDALAHFDLPDLGRDLRLPVAVLDPRGAGRQPLTAPEAQAAFSPIPAAMALAPSCTEAEALDHLRRLLSRTP
ncbi:MAG: hypothetical protein ABIL09_11475, partial [Gemmatimonadota bacterium]